MAYDSKPKKLRIIIPSTPLSEFTETDSDDTINGDIGLYSQPTTHYTSSPSPLKYPYRPVRDGKPQRGYDILQQEDLRLGAQEIASPNMLAAANLFASMKQTLQQMSATFDILERQSDRMDSLAVEVWHLENIRKAKSELEQQIARQKKDISNLRLKLEGEVRKALEDNLRERLCSIISDCVATQVKQKVRAELELQMSQKLCKELWQKSKCSPEAECSHFEIPEIVFSEPETVTELLPMYDEDMKVHAVDDTQLMSKPRFLLRPLPTPEQSPAYEIEDSVPFKSMMPTPVSAYPTVPACTPIKPVTPILKIPMRASIGMPSPVPTTPSPVTPRDIVDDFYIALNSDKHKTLLENFDSNCLTVPSPASDWPGSTVPIFKTPTNLIRSPLPIPPPAFDFGNVGTPVFTPRDSSRMQTPVVMVPPPPRPQPRRGNSLAENLKLLPPLVIT